MYKVRCHGNDQEMEVKIAVFVKYGIMIVHLQVPVSRGGGVLT